MPLSRVARLVPNWGISGVDTEAIQSITTRSMKRRILEAQASLMKKAGWLMNADSMSLPWFVDSQNRKVTTRIADLLYWT